MDGSKVWRTLVATAAWIVLAFLLLPSLITIPIAFGTNSAIVFPPKSFGFDMFEAFFTEPGWVASTWLSVKIALCTTILAVGVGVPAAYAVSRGRFPGRNLLALMLLSPIMIPGVVLALGLYLYFSKIGFSNGEARLVVGHTLVTLPFVLVTAMGGLRQIDPALETAARLSGAGRFTVIRRVTLPLLAPSLAAGALFAFLLSFDEIVISWFIAPPGETTLPIKMFASIQYDVSAVLAAISTMLTVLSTLFCVALALLQSKGPKP